MSEFQLALWFPSGDSGLGVPGFIQLILIFILELVAIYAIILWPR